ncbi:MAG: hypothetical protein Q8Q04_02595 [archaeon]|nr:hypothetical protein [archaeon]
MKKGFLDISFSWIFALIIGVVILFAAIYFVSQFSEVKDTQNSAEIGTSLFNVLLPLETGVDSGKSTTITLPVNSRISHFCDNSGTFGRDTISIQEFIRKKWTDTGVNISSKDRYLFLPRVLQGKEFYAFSKSYEFPFKIANLVYIINANETYCFSDAPREIENELKNFNQVNFKFDDCNSNGIEVCFDSGGDCDIEVNLNLRTVKKGNDIVYFEGNSLLYAATFSDKEIYECELSRLMKRGGKLTELYQEKSLNLVKVGCDSSLKTEFSGLKSSFLSLENSEDLFATARIVKEIGDANKYSECTLW